MGLLLLALYCLIGLFLSCDLGKGLTLLVLELDLVVFHGRRGTTSHGRVVLFRLIALRADAAAQLVRTEPVFLGSNHAA